MLRDAYLHTIASDFSCQTILSFLLKCSKAKVHDKKFVQDACCTPNETGSLTHHKQ